MKKIFIDYFKIPKVKNSEEYQNDKEDLKYEYDIIKRNNFYYLFEKGEMQEPFNWIIYDFSNAIKKIYGEVIYCIIEKNNNNINIIIGNSFEPYFELYHAKFIISEENKSNVIERLNSLLKINNELFNTNELIVFNINMPENEIYKIFNNINIKIESRKLLKKILSSLPIREPLIKKLTPIILAFISLIIIYSISIYFVNSHNKKIYQEMDNIKKDWITKIDKENKKILELKKEIKKYKAIENMKHKDIYRGNI